MDSQYEVSGKLLTFALQGQGPAHIVSGIKYDNYD